MFIQTNIKRNTNKIHVAIGLYGCLWISAKLFINRLYYRNKRECRVITFLHFIFIDVHENVNENMTFSGLQVSQLSLMFVIYNRYYVFK